MARFLKIILSVPKCKRKLAEVDEDNFNIADYACQSCGAIELEYFSKLLWD